MSESVSVPRDLLQRTARWITFAALTYNASPGRLYAADAEQAFADRDTVRALLAAAETAPEPGKADAGKLEPDRPRFKETAENLNDGVDGEPG